MFEVGTYFNNRSFDRDKLLQFGFKELEESYLYSTVLIKGEFNVQISVAKDGEVTADVIDAESGDFYVLVKVPDATGPFVGKIRTKLGSLLTEIAEKCFYSNVFQGHSTVQVINYIKNKYEDALEFLWEKFPKNAIVRRKDNAKWYVVILNLPQSKLGLPDSEAIDIIDLRAESSQIETLVDGKKYFPGYHMNKKHWISICLDGSVALDEIFKRIDDSYGLARK